MKPQEYGERTLQVAGWPVRLATYRLGETWHTRADNVSPGASLARGTGATRDDAEQVALARVRELLARTRRQVV